MLRESIYVVQFGFDLLVLDYIVGRVEKLTFNHVIVAADLFRRPSIPNFVGLSQFPSRCAHEFFEQSLLIIANRYRS